MLNLNTFEVRSNSALHRQGVYLLHIEDDLLGKEIIRIQFPETYNGTLYTRTAAITSFYEGKGPVVPNLVRYYKSRYVRILGKIQRGEVSSSMKISNPEINFDKYLPCLLRELDGFNL